jgi:hypothetical protein
MSVVERCPNCGTTSATPGECEACHEAQVRYFCTNHSPGLWLDARTCPGCGARFGEPADPSPTLAPALPARMRSPAPAPAAAPAPLGEEELEVGGARMALWQRLLAAAVRSRHLRTSAGVDPILPMPSRPPIGPGLGGCLKRFVLLAVLLLIALAGAVYLFGQVLIRGW